MTMKKILIPLFLLFGAFATAYGQTPVRVVLTTGSDDLRGGNSVFIKLNLIDGRSSQEVRVFSSGLRQNSSLPRTLMVRRSLTGGSEPPIPLREIQSITIRHDGSPRNGHPFDTYDNWDLQALSVSLAAPDGSPIANIYNSVADPGRNRFVVRFTGSTRQITLNRN